MALKIRLARFGKKGSPSYRIVVMPERSKREGKFIDMLGYYNPLYNPPKLTVSENKLKDWIKKGAKPTKTVFQLLKKKLNL